MKAPLSIMVDLSGSMNEMGKIQLQKNLCAYVLQLWLLEKSKYKDIELNFYKWTTEISRLTLDNHSQLPTFTAEGAAKLSSLADFIRPHLNKSPSARFLLFSDGNFASDDYKKFINWKKTQKLPLLRTLAIGADADILKLKALSTNKSCYLSENIAATIESVVFGTDEFLSAPKSINEIVNFAQVKSEPDEDWNA